MSKEIEESCEIILNEIAVLTSLISKFRLDTYNRKEVQEMKEQIDQLIETLHQLREEKDNG